MLFKLEFPHKTEYAQAIDVDYLINGHRMEYGADWFDVDEVTKISDEVAEDIMVEVFKDGIEQDVPLSNLCTGEEFSVLAVIVKQIE